LNITDSLSTIVAVSERKKSKNPNTQFIRNLIEQASTNITLLWVSSHVRILGNKKADDAAKEALNEEIHHTETYLPTPTLPWSQEKTLSLFHQTEKNDVL
jgi:ribonuclease HI